MNQIIKEDLDQMLTQRQDLDRLANQTILISGANSFIMSYFVMLLLENNRRNGGDTKILALCRSRANAEARLGDYLEDPHLQLLVQDVREPVEYEEDVDICIHAASPAGIHTRQEKPLDTFQINQFGCQNLLQLAQKKQSRKFLLLSSVDVYGDCRNQQRRRESDTGLLDWNYPRNAYAFGKRSAEALCTLCHIQLGMSCVMARPFQVYGPGISLTDGRLHGDFIRQLQESNQIVLKSDGSAVRSFLYLTDATHALLDILHYGKSGEAYNVCGEAEECSVKNLAERYAAQWSTDAKVIFSYEERDTPEVQGALLEVTGDSSKLRGLGWKSQVSLDEGIRRTLQFYANKEL